MYTSLCSVMLLTELLLELMAAAAETVPTDLSAHRTQASAWVLRASLVATSDVVLAEDWAMCRFGRDLR